MRRFRRLLFAGAVAAGGGFMVTAAPADAVCHTTPQVVDGQPDPLDRDGNGCWDCPASPLERLGIDWQCLQ